MYTSGAWILIWSLPDIAKHRALTICVKKLKPVWIFHRNSWIFQQSNWDELSVSYMTAFENLTVETTVYFIKEQGNSMKSLWFSNFLIPPVKTSKEEYPNFSETFSVERLVQFGYPLEKKLFHTNRKRPSWSGGLRSWQFGWSIFQWSISRRSIFHDLSLEMC